MRGKCNKRVRLSLECKASVKKAIEEHGKDLGEWSLIGAIRSSVRRSKKLFDLERRGDLVLIRNEDGKAENVPKS